MVFFRKHKKKLLLLFIILLVAVAVIGQEAYLPTYEYYGQILSMDEFLALYNELDARGEYLICTVKPTVEAYLTRMNYDYICFRTASEADEYDKASRQAWARLEALFPDYEFPAPPEGYNQPESSMTLSSNHWALFAHSGYNG